MANIACAIPRQPPHLPHHPLALFTLKRGGGKATQSSCQCASVCQLELTASHRSVQLNFEFSVLDFSNCTDRGQREWKLWQRQQWQQQRRSSTKRRELMKRIHMSTSISVLCSGFFASVEVFSTRVAQISYFLARRVAESTRLPRRRCCTAQSVTFFSQLSTLCSLQSLHSLFNCPHCWLSNICTCAYADAWLGVALIRPQFTRDSPTICPQLLPLLLLLLLLFGLTVGLCLPVCPAV